MDMDIKAALEAISTHSIACRGTTRPTRTSGTRRGGAASPSERNYLAAEAGGKAVYVNQAPILGGASP